MNMRLPLALFAVFAATACVASGATLRDIDNELKRIDLLLHPGQQEKAEGGATAQDRYTMAYDVIEVSYYNFWRVPFCFKSNIVCFPNG
jgi:arabinogalactan endo-1,4-beta-galactosidase